MAVNSDAVQPFHADWRRGRVTSWLTTVDHKKIGLLYIWTCLLFFALGGLLALLIRSQLLHPNEHFMTRSSYNQAVTMSYTTVNGTATTSDSDYIAKTGTLTFAPGETTKTITIEVKGDSKKEADATFYLDLFGNSSNSLFTKNRGLGTILNDD